jgi:2,3-dihydroxybenzoate-AMP ligase
MPIDGFTPYTKEEIERYTSMRWWLGLTWGDVFNKHTDVYPDKTGLVDGTGSWTNRELRQSVDKLAVSFIELGIQPKDRVLLQLPNWHEFVFSFLALQKIGAITVVLIPRHNQTEINHFCKLTEPVAWILPEQYGKIAYQQIIDDVLRENPRIKNIIQVRTQGETAYHALEKLIDQGNLTPANEKALEHTRPDPDEVSQILPTGGTTGLPKLSPRTHNCYMNNVEYHGYRWEITSQDTIMVVTPLGHNLSVHWGLGAALLFHAKLVVLDSVRPEDICEWVQREGVTAIPAVPALFSRIVQMPDLSRYDLTSLKKISVGGAPSTPELVKSVYEKIGAQFVNGFGSVEGTCASTRLGDSIELICGSVGTPICPYDELKVVDQNDNEVGVNVDGELVSKGPGIFTGYFKAAEKEKTFTKDGYFRTGDQAKKDAEGNIWITGRIKDIIIRGGENISAVEIESMMSEYPGLVDSAVVGMPDKILGERVCAYLVLKPGAQVTLEGLVSYLKGKGASVLQLPERIEVIEEIPTTRVGKADKKRLRETIRRKMELEAKI